MKCAMRRVSTVVLPVPAPAMIRSGPSPWSTASRWAAERPARMRSSAIRGSVPTSGEDAAVGPGAPAMADQALLGAVQHFVQALRGEAGRRVADDESRARGLGDA